VQSGVDRAAWIVGKRERAREVPAGAPCDDGELDVVAAGDAVDDLVDGAVAADDDEELRAGVGRVAREPGQLTGSA